MSNCLRSARTNRRRRNSPDRRRRVLAHSAARTSSAPAHIAADTSRQRKLGQQRQQNAARAGAEIQNAKLLFATARRALSMSSTASINVSVSGRGSSVCSSTSEAPAVKFLRADDARHRLACKRDAQSSRRTAMRHPHSRERRARATKPLASARPHDRAAAAHRARAFPCPRHARRSQRCEGRVSSAWPLPCAMSAARLSHAFLLHRRELLV